MDYIALLHQIMQEGKIIKPGGKECRELQHVQLEIYNNLYAFPGIRDLDFILNYWHYEFAWYMSGDRDGKFIEQYAKLWTRIKNEDNSLNSNYGHLVFYNQTPHPSMRYLITLPPFEWAARALEQDQESRQAMVTYNTGGFNFEGNRDYICSQHQAFFIRDGVLHCYIALRSSDAIFGLTYNMPWWSLVAQQLLKRLHKTYPNLVLGSMKVTIYSAHIYQPHYDLVEKMLAGEHKKHHAFLREEIPLNCGYQHYLENFDKYVAIMEVN